MLFNYLTKLYRKITLQIYVFKKTQKNIFERLTRKYKNDIIYLSVYGHDKYYIGME